MVQQIEETAWTEIANPIDLCAITINYEEVEEKLGIKFFDIAVDGLGYGFGALLEFDGRQCSMREITAERTEVGSRLSVQMLSFEETPHELVVSIKESLQLKREQFVWVHEPLCSPQWEVWCSMDGVDYKKYAFHYESFAKYMIKKSNSEGGNLYLKLNKSVAKFSF